MRGGRLSGNPHPVILKATLQFEILDTDEALEVSMCSVSGMHIDVFGCKDERSNVVLYTTSS